MSKLKKKALSVHDDAAFNSLIADFDANEVRAFSKDDIQATENWSSHGIRMRDTDKQEFKEFCVRHKMKMSDAFIEAFKLLRKHHNG